MWPGLTVYRFTAPAGPSWEEIQSLSLCVVAQGRKAVTVDGETYLYDPFHYLVLSSHLHFQAEILEASPSLPFLSFVLQIEPALVRRVSSDMLERRTTAFRSRPGEAQAPEGQALVSALDQELLGAVLRFLRAVGRDTDRRVLAPLYLQEMVFRVLQREQFARLLSIAAAQAATNPVSAVLDYVRAHLSEPLTVADMAEQVSLSPSAFAHLFRDVTGRSPYQFLKEMRLDQARELLVDGNLAVARVSKEVGYASVSHFISEFRGRFGVTPRAYCDMNAMHPSWAASGNAGPQHAEGTMVALLGPAAPANPWHPLCGGIRQAGTSGPALCNREANDDDRRSRSAAPGCCSGPCRPARSTRNGRPWSMRIRWSSPGCPMRKRSGPGCGDRAAWSTASSTWPSTWTGALIGRIQTFVPPGRPLPPGLSRWGSACASTPGARAMAARHWTCSPAGCSSTPRQRSSRAPPTPRTPRCGRSSSGPGGPSPGR